MAWRGAGKGSSRIGLGLGNVEKASARESTAKQALVDAGAAGR